MAKIRVLSIDGGGIRGILPGVVLTRLEKKLQNRTGNESARLSDFFDFMAGTSTGGILSLTYLVPNESGKSKFSAQDAVNLYLEKGGEIFDISIWRTMGSLINEKYSAQALEENLSENYKDLMLSDLVKPCIICSYDIQNGRPHFFKQHKSDNKIYNFRLKDVARSTSAAPTYFEPALVKNEIGSPFHLIDGGVFANNPALVAYSELRGMDISGITNPTAKDMMIVSLGTGSQSEKYSYDEAKDWGLIRWAKPVIEIMMSGNAESVHHHMQRIFDTVPDGEGDYFRLNPTVKVADKTMDNAEAENLKRLEEDAKSYLSESETDQQLDIIVEKLIQNSTNNE